MNTKTVIISIALAKLLIAALVFRLVSPTPLLRWRAAILTYALLFVFDAGLRSMNGSDSYLSLFYPVLFAFVIGAAVSISILYFVRPLLGQMAKSFFVIAIFAGTFQILSDVNRGLDFGPVLVVDRGTARGVTASTYVKGVKRTARVLDFGGQSEVGPYTLPQVMGVNYETYQNASNGISVEISPGLLRWPWYRSVSARTTPPPVEAAPVILDPKLTALVQGTFKGSGGICAGELRVALSRSSWRTPFQNCPEAESEIIAVEQNAKSLRAVIRFGGNSESCLSEYFVLRHDHAGDADPNGGWQVTQYRSKADLTAKSDAGLNCALVRVRP